LTNSASALSLKKTEVAKIRSEIGNKLWRLTNLYKIDNKVSKQLTSLTLNPIQRQIYEAVKDRSTLREYVLKYRQGGVSTFWLIWWLDETIFNPNNSTGILSHEKQSLNHLWTIIRVAYDHMPEEYKPRSGKYNEHELTFPDINSRIFVSLSIRSTRVDNLHISEVCHMEANDIRASKAAVPPNGNITVESTAHGIGNEGYNLYQDGKAGQNHYNVYFFPWFIQPEYRVPLNGLQIVRTKDEEKFTARVAKEWNMTITDEQILWRRQTQKDQGVLFAQEYPEDDETAFLSTGNPYFDGKKVMALLKEAREMERETPPFEETYDYVMWDRPTKGDVYVAGADVAEGIDGDYSVLAIFNVTKRKQAFRLRGHFGVDAFYRMCNEWGRAYNNCLLAVERNNHGHAVLLGLYETMRYPNLFVQDQETRVTRTRGVPEPKKIVKIGWTTDRNTKPIMLDQLKVAIEGDSLEDVDTFQPEFTVYDQIFLQEALTTQQEGDTISAASGKHDDAVVAWAIAFQMYLKMKGRINKSLDSGILVGDSLKAIGIL